MRRLNQKVERRCTAILPELNPAKKPYFVNAIVANPSFSYRWDPTEAMGEDVRFKSSGLAPKSAADFAFLLHGFHFLKDKGVMAIILPHDVLFRGGAEECIRTKLLKDGHIDTVTGPPSNLFYSTGIPVCTLILKKCKKPDDVLFINAAEPSIAVYSFFNVSIKAKIPHLLLGSSITFFISEFWTFVPKPKSSEFSEPGRFFKSGRDGGRPSIEKGCQWGIASCGDSGIVSARLHP